MSIYEKDIEEKTRAAKIKAQILQRCVAEASGKVKDWEDLKFFDVSVPLRFGGVDLSEFTLSDTRFVKKVYLRWCFGEMLGKPEAIEAEKNCFPVVIAWPTCHVVRLFLSKDAYQEGINELKEKGAKIIIGLEMPGNFSKN